MTEPLDAEVMVAIRSVAHRATDRLWRFGYEREDVEQEFALHYLQHRHHFNASRAAADTFAAHICKTRALGMLAQATAQKRGGGATLASLSEPITFERDRANGAGAETKPRDLREIRPGRRFKSEADLLALRIDVGRVVQTLPPDLASLALTILAGQSISDVVRVTGISRATLYRRMARLRTAFREAGLQTNPRIQEAA